MRAFRPVAGLLLVLTFHSLVYGNGRWLALGDEVRKVSEKGRLVSDASTVLNGSGLTRTASSAGALQSVGTRSNRLERRDQPVQQRVLRVGELSARGLEIEPRRAIDLGKLLLLP